MIADVFGDIVEKYSRNKQTVTLQEFQKFLIEEQSDPMSKNPSVVANYIKDYLQDVQRDVAEPYMTIEEFIDFLWSSHNQIWDKNCSKIYQDMTRPLSHYYISSSHNTYLTGDQFSSESTTEAYVRALRMGCRCIELDCWDGPENMPLIFHGHTFTSKIKFKDVIQTIKDNAFVTSEYPLILSIEQNCSLLQQRKMAQAMQDMFGDMLLTQQIEKNETQLPSPFALRRRIILKHKKLPDGNCKNNAIDEATGAVHRGTLIRPEDAEMDLRTSIKNGILYLEDAVDKIWNPHFFVLTHQKLYYTERHRQAELEDIRDDETEIDPLERRESSSLAHDELHFGENWFHGKLGGGREEAENLLRQYAHLGDGTFLVRESVTFIGDYCLSFLRQGRPNHCRIKLKHENTTTKYYLIENVMFDSLYSLIMHYRKNILRSSEFSITLKEPVPQPKKHEGKEWYHPNTTKEQSEQVLKLVPNEGAFLVRPSDKGNNSYVISFRANQHIKHCRITVDGRLYIVGAGGMEFESLVDLVNFYLKYPLYKKVKLQYPVSKDMLKRIGNVLVSFHFLALFF